MAELKYWVWLSTRRGIGQAKLGILLRSFGSPEDLYFARSNDLAPLVDGDVGSLRDKSLEGAKKILRDCDECGAEIITLGDARYPSRLKNIYDPPVLLYVKGRLPAVDDRAAVALVGTRDCTAYGLVTAEKMAYDVTRAGAVVVTGLARGVDSAAARGALRGGGSPIGVLGCGIDVVYPKNNASLFADVASVGALVSEYPPGAEPNPKNFPARNRIISGLSLGVVVVEAPVKSGALITARLALDQGRDVFAVPGNVDAPNSAGCNALLREGAIMAMNGEDVISEYRGLFPDSLSGYTDNEPLSEDVKARMVERELRAAAETPKRDRAKKKTENNNIDNNKPEYYIEISVDPADLSDEERAVLWAIRAPHTHVDDVIAASGLSAQEVLSTLTMLEIDGAVTQESGKRFTANIKLN